MSISKTPASRVRAPLRSKRARTLRSAGAVVETQVDAPTKKARTKKAPTTKAPTTKAPTTKAPTEEAPVPVAETASQEVQLLRALLAERDATIALLEGRLRELLERDLEQANVEKELPVEDTLPQVPPPQITQQQHPILESAATEDDGMKNHDMNHEGSSVAPAEAIELDDDEYGVFPLRPEDATEDDGMENHDMNHEGSSVAPAEAVEPDDDEYEGPMPLFGPERPKGVFPRHPDEESDKENASCYPYGRIPVEPIVASPRSPSPFIGPVLPKGHFLQRQNMLQDEEEKGVFTCLPYGRIPVEPIVASPRTPSPFIGPVLPRGHFLQRQNMLQDEEEKGVFTCLPFAQGTKRSHDGDNVPVWKRLHH